MRVSGGGRGAWVRFVVCVDGDRRGLRQDTTEPRGISSTARDSGGFWGYFNLYRTYLKLRVLYMDLHIPVVVRRRSCLSLR